MESVLGTATEENWYIISVYSGILTVALSASKKGVGCIYRGNLFIIEHIKKDANNGN